MTSSKSAARNSRYPLGNTDALKTFILVECPFTEPHHTVREGDTLHKQNQIGVSRKIIKPRLFSIAYASSLLLLMLLWESETTLDDVFFMHFETNKLLNLF